MNCVFCAIAEGKIPAEIIHENEHSLVFLDVNPLFPGHLLISPRKHYETLADLPQADLGPLFAQVQRATRAVEAALASEGSFVAQNNRVSQSVPHLHVHVVPRRKGDGLKGFFWPRVDYRDAEHRSEIADKLRTAFREAEVAA